MVDKETYWKKVNFIVDTSIFIRNGACNRCGKCCYAYDEEHPPEEGIKVPCTKLSYDGALAICGIQENKYQICKDNPIYPTPCMVSEAVDTCGYSWVVDNSLTKTKALDKFNIICDVCHRKEPCTYYDKIVNEINEVCK
ncbi:hypothetical protein LCGC14_0223740 [marine sediment metagenome]|uniref:Uncharacterized protein n=1 Tax=marine sediment metagenome TaxID=412755 RepID=A0A0F9WWQ4_9ZZZZ